MLKEAVEVTVNSNENMLPIKTVQHSEIFNCNQCGQTANCKANLMKHIECYKYMYISSSQCCQKLYSNLIECGLENEIKEVGIQKVSLDMFKQVDDAKKLR